MHLVSNGTHLLKRNVLTPGAGGGIVTEPHLVRTPIFQWIHLTPDSRQYYAIAQNYKSLPSGIYPTSGVLGDGSGTQSVYVGEVAKTGKTMRRWANQSNTRPSYQEWRPNGYDNHPAEFVFYQGGYSTSTSTLIPEAFAQFIAYHFTIPQQYANMAVGAARLKLTHGGTIIKYKTTWDTAQWSDGQGHTLDTAYFAAQAPTFLLPANSGFRGAWTQPFGIFPSLNNDITALRRAAQGTLTLDTHLVSGDCTLGRGSARLMWDVNSVVYRDGYIPVTSAPWTQTVDLAAGHVSALQNLRGGWIVGLPNVGVSTAADTVDTAEDYPIYSPPSDGLHHWLCCSYWGLELDVGLVIL